MPDYKAPMDDLPTEAAITVSRAFQDFVAGKQGRQHLLALAAVLASFALFFSGKKAMPYVDVGALFAVINAVAWFTARHRTWYYAISTGSMNLFWLKPSFGETLWQEVQWKQNTILSVEQEEWRGLPALRLKVKLKGHKTPQDMWMVYAHEDQDTVQNVVLPLIEKYRKQYRHEFWADALRQEE